MAVKESWRDCLLRCARCVAGDAELVSVWISKVRAIVVFMVLGPQARRTFRRTAMRESGFVRGVNDDSIRGANPHSPMSDYAALIRPTRDGEARWDLGRQPKQNVRKQLLF